MVNHVKYWAINALLNSSKVTSLIWDLQFLTNFFKFYEQFNTSFLGIKYITGNIYMLFHNIYVLQMTSNAFKNWFNTFLYWF